MKTVGDVRSFLCFDNLNRRFIKAHAPITVPLTHFGQKDGPREWAEKCQQALDHLEERFTLAPIRPYFDLNVQTVLETDATNFVV